MSQRHIETIVGRLVTDEDFRRRFVAGPDAALEELGAAGIELTAAEREALATDAAVWGRLAQAIDPRLQKVSLRPS
jgi:putative modified peptide